MIEGMNKAFESRLRLGIMGLLMVNDYISFADMKENLGATDGNIASHTTALEKMKYLAVKKEFVNKKPLTSYSITRLGRQAFQNHLMALETIIKSAK